MGKLFRSTLPTKMQELLNLDETSYKVEGSIGQVNLAEIPWISVFYKDSTKTATNGYYIVYLFKSDMSGFYLSLNQGWTYFEKKYRTKQGKI